MHDGDQGTEGPPEGGTAPPAEARRKGRPRRGERVTLRIDGLAARGVGVGRADGFVLFVPGTAPGDRILAEVRVSKRRHGEAECLEVLEPGEARVQPRCPHFGRCGGCAWQHLSYAAQLREKEAMVRDSLERIGGFRDLPLRPILAAPDPYHYRNKMEFAFHPEAILGLHARGRFDEVVPIEACHIASPRVSALVAVVRDFVRREGLPCYDKRTHGGLLRHLVVREARSTGEILVGIVTTSDPFPKREALRDALLGADPEIQSIVHAVNDDRADTVNVEALTVLHGRDHIVERLGGIPYEIRLQTFFQTHTVQAERMVEEALALAEPAAGDLCVDLFCGVGTFALHLAPHVAQVVGIEIVEAAVLAARQNARRAGMGNATFWVGDARRTLPKVVEQLGTPDLFVLDPPRSGAGGKVMRRIGRCHPRRILYVSCNPASLAADLKELTPFGYEITAVQPLDLFPQTWHVETLVRLDRLQGAEAKPGPAVEADAGQDAGLRSEPESDAEPAP